MSNLPVTLLCGEKQTSRFTFKNIGQTALKNLHLICSCPHSFAFSATSSKGEGGCKYPVANTPGELGASLIDIPDLSKEYKGLFRIPLLGDDENTDRLLPDQETTLEVSVYGALSPGVHEIYLLFYYEPEGPELKKKTPYRLLQQMIRMQTLSTLSVTTSIQKSFCKQVGDNSSPCTTGDDDV